MTCSKISDETFFIVDSENLEKIKSHIYGFCFQDRKLVANCDIPDGWIAPETGPCAFTLLLRKEDRIRIIQDPLSLFYLFIYKADGYFCLSNSFYAMCEHLKRTGHNLTLDKTYASQLISTTLSPLSLANTLAKEIKIIPMFSEIGINVQTGKITINKVSDTRGKVDVDSIEGMTLLDDWISDWGTFMNSVLHNSKIPAVIDLTGGYDSRTVFSVAYKSGIDFNAENIFVHSNTFRTEGQRKKFEKDLETANKIADLLGFTLNQNTGIGDRTRISGKASYEIFKCSMMGFHREGYFGINVYNAPFFHLGGYYGEPVRGKVRSLKKWKTKIWNPGGSPYAVYWELLKDYLRMLLETGNDFEALRKFYMATWGRNHFGLQVVRDFLSGKFVVCPFFDLRIFDLKLPDGIDKDAIFALIIQRTCPQLMRIPFSDGTDFSDKTKKFVKDLCEKYESKIRISGDSYDFSSFQTLGTKPYPDEFPEKSGNDYMFKVFTDETNRQRFVREFGKDGDTIYNHAEKYYSRKDVLYPNQFCVAVVSIMEFLNIIQG